MNLHQPTDRQADKLLEKDAAAERLTIEKFAVGQSVPRNEDPMLLRGYVVPFDHEINFAGAIESVNPPSVHSNGAQHWPAVRRPSRRWQALGAHG